VSTVLVTGGSGFIAAHCIAQLLAAGHRVRATVRAPEREARVRSMLQQSGAAPDDNLSFAVADLEADAGWREAAAGCDYVLHVASPFPLGAPRHEDDLIRPAREGALRVLRAARDAGVRRVVLTSSFAAVGYGHAPQNAPFDETAWTNVDGPAVTSYTKSKTLAERAAWDFIEREGAGLELAAVNPVGVLGPVLGADYATSVRFVKMLLDGAIPGCPDIRFGVVDVRDVADLHLRAMSHPAAAGERFIASAGDIMSLLDVAQTLKGSLGDRAKRVPLRRLPDWTVRLGAVFSPSLRQLAPQLGKARRASSAKAQQLLGWSPRPREEAVIAAVESLIRLGLLDKR
jgi:nucleoside-diphosphate-sugar epimerase